MEKEGEREQLDVPYTKKAGAVFSVKKISQNHQRISMGGGAIA